MKPTPRGLGPRPSQHVVVAVLPAV